MRTTKVSLLSRKLHASNRRSGAIHDGGLRLGVYGVDQQGWRNLFLRGGTLRWGIGFIHRLA
jgi:hypothetical protein